MLITIFRYWRDFIYLIGILEEYPIVLQNLLLPFLTFVSYPLVSYRSRVVFGCFRSTLRKSRATLCIRVANVFFFCLFAGALDL